MAVDATLDQAVLNLLANAVTASPSWVVISAGEKSGERLEMMIEDRGDGLKSGTDESPGEQIVNSENGLGVGLFLSNATIQRFGGILKASVSGEGTTMIIDLPMATENDGNVSATARALNMHRRTLQRKLQKHSRWR